jgi:hypothetical protein
MSLYLQNVSTHFIFFFKNFLAILTFEFRALCLLGSTLPLEPWLQLQLFFREGLMLFAQASLSLG